MAQQTAEHCINPSEWSSNSDNSGSISSLPASGSIVVFEFDRGYRRGATDGARP